MKIAVIILLAASVLTACGANQVLLESELLAVDDNSEYRLIEDVKITASNTKSLVLKANTRWTITGQIEHGNVFRTKDQVVVVNS